MAEVYYDNGQVKIIHGNVLDALKILPDESVDCIVTSPPYYSLRDYSDNTNIIWDGDPNCDHVWGEEIFQKVRGSAQGKTSQVGERVKKASGVGFKRGQFCLKCGAWYGQLGLEPNLDLYLVHMWQITDELFRILKKTGVMFWNHGDNYSGGSDKEMIKHSPSPYNVPVKSMVLQNERFALGLIDIDYRILVEWRAMGKPEGKLEEMLKNQRIQAILRNRIIWRKLNAMPESVRDRLSTKYEPVYIFVKNRKYWFDLDSIRLPHKETSIERAKRKRLGNQKYEGKPQYKGCGQINTPDGKPLHPLGKNPGDVWDIATQPFKGSHFACVDGHTEILTKEGWKKWNEIAMDDEIATLDILNETIYYHKPYAIYRYNYEGKLIVIENKWVAQYVTPNHRVLLKYVHSALKKQPDEFWHYKRADSIRPHSGVLIPLSGKYEGELDVGSVERAELLGWILTEGCFTGLTKGKGITIYQSNHANPHKVKRIEELLRECNIDYTRTDRLRQKSVIKDKVYIRHEVAFYIKKSGKNWQWILEWINEDKMPQWKLLHIRKEQLEALYRGIIAGDGHHRKDGRDSFVQKNDYMREWFRTLCVHLGKRTTEYNKPYLRSAGTVYVTNQNYAQIHSSDFKECVKKIKYKGIVWCPHLPNTNFVARRKGNDGEYRYFITGNTFPERLIHPMVKAGCPKWVCAKCGKARERITQRTGTPPKVEKTEVGKAKDFKGSGVHRAIGQKYQEWLDRNPLITIGWTDCGCDAGWEPGVVLDPFMGSGTTGLVALKHGVKFIGIELNIEYIEQIAMKRLEPYLKQMSLFDMEAI